MATADTITSNLLAMGFNNPSNAALFNKIAQSVGGVIDSTITEFANSEARILNTINTQRYGKSGYYTSAALAFQYGYNLSIDPVTLNYYYSTIDTTVQIVKQAAFQEFVSGNQSQLFLKIAAQDATSGLLIPLTAVQLQAFSNYFVNFQIPGLPVTIISNAGNVLSFTATATYYATYNLTTLQTNITNALSAFQKSFVFNGQLFAGDIQNYIKTNVPGIRDFYVYNTMIDSVPFTGSINLTSGYFNYITNLNNSITYTAI